MASHATACKWVPLCGKRTQNSSALAGVGFAVEPIVPDAVSFPGIAVGARWWCSAIPVACQCLDFRTHNPKVAGSNPAPQPISPLVNPELALEQSRLPPPP